MLSELGAERLRRLAGSMERWVHPKGGPLMRRGEVSECAYILVSGRAIALDADADAADADADAGAGADARLPTSDGGGDLGGVMAIDETRVVMAYDSLDAKARLLGTEAMLPHAPARAHHVRLEGGSVVYAMARRAYRSALRRVAAVELDPILRDVKALCLSSDDGLGPPVSALS
jgi:hypothetical protein